jgi:hypothetical protein
MVGGYINIIVIIDEIAVHDLPECQEGGRRQKKENY